MKIDKPGLQIRPETSGGFRNDSLLLHMTEHKNEKMRQILRSGSSRSQNLSLHGTRARDL
jgi:hypothetical protein